LAYLDYDELQEQLIEMLLTKEDEIEMLKAMIPQPGATH